MGVQLRSYRHAWMEARERLSALPLGRLRRGHALVCARSRLADVSPADGELRGVDLHLRVERDIWPRVPVWRFALHPSILAPMDRLPWDPGCLHARQGY